MSDDDCRSPIGLDCCSCCLDLANGCADSAQGLGTAGGPPASPASPSVSHFRQLRNQLMYQNLNTDKLNNIMRQDSLESVVRDPCFLLNEGVCNSNSNIDQTMLSILLFFHRLQRVSTNRLMERGPAHLAPFSPVHWRRRHCRQRGSSPRAPCTPCSSSSPKTPQLLFPHRT
ncbi:TSC22 domain family protein 3 isoform X2 [Nelusetta ayraudi]|uniref:TSC22 domain family protein 3 isoform X2 n=1 Tax=Nelusetta ayraudi TaxID=303726 RepID=UPI003F6F9FD2